MWIRSTGDITIKQKHYLLYLMVQTNVEVFCSTRTVKLLTLQIKRLLHKLQEIFFSLIYYIAILIVK